MALSSEDLQEFSRFAHRLADAARVETLPRFRDGADVVNKAGAHYDPVTDADREAERVIADMVAQAYPEHGFIGEEFGARGGDGPYRWVVDPVDGTRAFVSGAPTWTTLIALEHQDAPALGVIDQPYTDERWVGDGKGARFFRGGAGKSVRTSGLVEISKARISTTDPRSDGYMSAAAAERFARLAVASRLARFSLDAYAYGLLAIGELDIVAETSLQHYDYAALRPVVEGAGGVMTNWRGDPVGSDDNGEALAAATPALHAAAIEILAG